MSKFANFFHSAVDHFRSVAHHHRAQIRYAEREVIHAVLMGVEEDLLAHKHNVAAKIVEDADGYVNEGSTEASRHKYEADLRKHLFDAFLEFTAKHAPKA